MDADNTRRGIRPARWSGNIVTYVPKAPRPWREVVLAMAIGVALGFVLAGIFVATWPPCPADEIGALIRSTGNGR